MDPPPQSLATALQDLYRVERQLGRGGMADVYLAQDLRHDRPVALKVMRPELSGLLGRERFVREIEIASRLQHPSILPLFDSGSADGSLFYVMPFVEGETLRQLIDREKQLGLDDVLAIAQDVADALEYAHSHGVVHRDIKPGNILLAPAATSSRNGGGGWRALVADFGIARAITAAAQGDLTTRGLAVGTPTYMSPEQASGQSDVDGRSDLYSLACVVYEMLAGQPPFSGPTPQAVAARHLYDSPPSLRTVRPSLPAQFQRVLEKGLAKVRADRYRTVGEFVAELERAGRATDRGGRFRLIAVAAAVGATAVLALLWPRTTTNNALLDRNKVVVFPLAEIPSGRQAGGMGEAIAVLIESALEHTEPLRWIDGGQRLDPSQRTDPGRVIPAVARRIAQGQRARWYTTGSILVHAESATVILQLNDTQGDSLVSQATAAAPIDRAPQAGLRAVNQLLVPILAGGRRVDLSSLEERRPAAVASWLQGEQAYRRGHFDTALTYLVRAVEEDSALALAAVRGAQAASWENLLPQAATLASVALARVALLPDRQAEFTRGLVHYLGGSADSAVHWLSRALTRSPEWTEAHMALGEVYHHLLPSGTLPSESIARKAFLAAAADTGFAPAHFHLAEIAIESGDLVSAEKELERFAQPAGEGEGRDLRLALACARGGPAAVDWVEVVGRDPSLVLSASKMLSAAGAYPKCVESGARTLLGKSRDVAARQGAFILLRNLWAAEGRIPELLHVVDSVTTNGWWQVGSAVFPLMSLAGLTEVEPQVQASVVRLRGTYGAAYLDSLDSGRLLLLGTWYAHSGEGREADRFEVELRNRAQATGDRAARLGADALAAHLRLARGDSAGAIEALRRLSPVAQREFIAWGTTEALPVERMTLAELLAAAGDQAGALAVAEQLDHPAPVAFLPFLPASLALRYSAARALGQRERAAEYRDRLEALGRADLIPVQE